MYNATEQFAEFNKVGIEQAMRLAQIAMEKTEQLMKLHMEIAKSAFEDNVKNAKAIADVKDWQEMIAMRARMAENGLEKSLAYSRNVYEVASEAQAEVAELVEQGLAVYTKGMSTMVDRAAKAAPAGSDAAVNALKSTVAATNAAIDTFTKASKQVASFADASMKAATQATAQAVKNNVKAPARKAA